MHRVKVLEFDRVILAAINDGIVPLSAAVDSEADAVAKREGELHERLLFYIASPRAKIEVLVICFGNASDFISVARKYTGRV
jgi:superfamily I DNA/RNA helicase